MGTKRWSTLGLACGACVSLASSVLAGATVHVGAAISLKDSLDAIAPKYEAATGDHIEPTYGASGQIQTQIKNGAPIDVFVSAANKQVDELQNDGLVDAFTRRVVVTNHLVLVVPANAANTPKNFWELTFATTTKIAVGEPKTVPAGQYAEQALTSMKLMEPVREKLVYGTNVRQVLAYVERGEVSAGIVYLTDAKQAGDKVKIVDTADASRTDPIVYPGVVLKNAADHAAALRFLEYLSQGEAQAIFKDKGFVTAESVTTQPSTTQPAQPAAKGR